MSTDEPIWRTAWEPLTPRGVAAFAGSSLGRLLAVQFLVALLASGSVAWFLETGWYPVVWDAIHNLPHDGDNILNGKLEWSGESPQQQLAQNRFLGLAVDLYHSGELGREAHLQVEFGREDFRIYSLLGYTVIDYPPDWNSAFNRTGLEPWWGAWSPWIMISTCLVVMVALMLSWTLLATVYCVPVRVFSFLENRDLEWGQSWLLAGAAMMPGALFLTAGIAAYTLGWLDLIRLGGIFGLHFVVGWIYLIISPFFCPLHSAVKKASANPFAAPEESPASQGAK